MTTSQRLEQCGHGLGAWKVDGVVYHERKDPTYNDGSQKLPSAAAHLDVCDQPPAKAKKGARA